MIARVHVKIATWWRDLGRRAQEERGASAVEYGVLLVLIIGILVLVIQAVGDKTGNNFEKVNTAWQ